MSAEIVPFSLKDAPALIERLLPVQKLSAESFKEQSAVHGKTLTAIGGYWKGRKPLILNKACILGCLLPTTANSHRDLDVFEKLMGMDSESFVCRLGYTAKPKDLVSTLGIANIRDFFVVKPDILPASSPIDWSDPAFDKVKIFWRDDLTQLQRKQLEAQMLPRSTYREWVAEAQRPEEVATHVHEHIWDSVNKHLGTCATSFSELVLQLGIMRFGHRPRVADTFCGSGQIPFEAGRLGCDVYASDLNPIACMLTWANFSIVGSRLENQNQLVEEQATLVQKVQYKVDELGIEIDGQGWRGKAYLYCVEARCPQSEWIVPLLPTLVVSRSHRTIAELVPDHDLKRYVIVIKNGVSDPELAAAEFGTVGRSGRFGDAYLIHKPGTTTFKTSISTLRGDYERSDGSTGNRVRPWGKSEFSPHPDDIFQERLYCVQWMRSRSGKNSDEYHFRSVSAADLGREKSVNDVVGRNIVDWQVRGLVPDMRIEAGEPPRYQGLDLINSRGWTHWNHAFNPRQLLVSGLLRGSLTAELAPCFAQTLNSNSRLSPWSSADGGGGAVKQTFANQALNSLFNYGCRGCHIRPACYYRNTRVFQCGRG